MRIRENIAALLIFTAFVCAATPTSPSRPLRLAIMDIELTGDLGGPELTPEHEARARMASDRLRAELGRTQLYEIADNARAQETIRRFEAIQYLHQCNGCELDIARALGAEQVLVAWVHRVSNLILALNYEIRRTPSGTVVARNSFSFRGDNDPAWMHAVDSLVEDLRERGIR
ncbi:MAG TPA: DUF3280 domain-containing protein [Steroidobacter sp.]|jgi:hypothetical protein|nr:DUF3280 domain-containing protein [Steroidobacter sp.]